MKILMVELTNHCNEDCWFCPHSKMIREKGFMSMDTVKQVISKMVDMGQTNIVLNNLGESLLHPKFFDIVEMFTDVGINTNVSTNVRALDDGLVTKIKESSLSSIMVSMDFATSESEQIISHLIDDPRVTVNIKGATYSEISAFRKRYGNKAIIKFLTNFADQMDFHGDTKYDKYCRFLEENLVVILWDGRVCACCYDYEGDNILGSLADIEKLQHRKHYDLCEKCEGLDMRLM